MANDQTFIASDGTKLVVRVIGQGWPIVFLHGSNGGLDSTWLMALAPAQAPHLIADALRQRRRRRALTPTLARPGRRAQDGRMDIPSCTALVTGANRGLGSHFATQLLQWGAKVYAGARNPDSITLDGVIPVALDVTDPASVAAAVDVAGDVTLLINNAGIATDTDLLTGDLDEARRELDTNYFGTLSVTRAFAPVIEGNGGGGVLNVLSVLSWFSIPESGGYCASKSAAWSMTNALRAQLVGKGIRVTALHVGLMDTDMTAGMDGPKADPADVAAQGIDGIAAGVFEVLADEISRTVQAGLAGGVAALYPQL